MTHTHRNGQGWRTAHRSASPPPTPADPGDRSSWGNCARLVGGSTQPRGPIGAVAGFPAHDARHRLALPPPLSDLRVENGLPVYRMEVMNMRGFMHPFLFFYVMLFLSCIAAWVGLIILLYWLI
ncbi:hypothetical protein [Caudoviricetes sp.]|nr:hypothetical protein [Caudoviricetes sp.]UOF79682.1 hypothetical protein [Caudoviricetes sp.]UOF79844.1 hypothetical protein [Bacteriophage sp.]UOF81353.1 hypothetical protein [Caudoviricetes sp.]